VCLAASDRASRHRAYAYTGCFDSVRVEDELCRGRATWYNSTANVYIGRVGERESEEMVGECLSAEEVEAGLPR